MDEPVRDDVEEAAEALRRQRLLDQHNAAYAALKADPQMWQKELDERQGWERATTDGLESA